MPENELDELDRDGREVRSVCRLLQLTNSPRAFILTSTPFWAVGRDTYGVPEDELDELDRDDRASV
jgi:hypothetical protein